jgi:hypothetical protein
MKNFGFTWMANPPRGVRKGEAFASGEEVYVFEGGNSAALIARAATRTFAKLIATTYNQKRNRPRRRRARKS